MYKDFDSIDSLFETIKADKEANGSNSSTLNRYPIRFVLFDSFRDQYAFTLMLALLTFKIGRASCRERV